MKKFKILSVLLCLLLSSRLYAKKSYQQKSIYQGYGKVSKSTGKIKTKAVSGHWKGNPAKGYKYVNSYSKSR